MPMSFPMDADDLETGDKITQDGLKIMEVIETGVEKRGRDGVILRDEDSDDPDDNTFASNRRIEYYYDDVLIAGMKAATDGHSVEGAGL